ncbi:peroxisomal membrane protein 2 isoform X1 [Aotus nancymaae]|uniref:peroxisomal membrane protein 2 isoform X1 n=1 Tax=Aotus nancymaae TaxID=37293 RepID=UPI0030FEB022
MAPAASRLWAEAGLGALPRRALVRYLLLLRLYPVLTKAATSGILSALGNFLAQMIEKKRKKENSRSLDVSGPLRYAVNGFFFTGPLSHFFRLFMEHRLPPEVPLDRRLFAPAFLMLFFRAMNVWRLECNGMISAHRNLHLLGSVERRLSLCHHDEGGLLASPEDELEGVDASAVHQHQLRPSAGEGHGAQLLPNITFSQPSLPPSFLPPSFPPSLPLPLPFPLSFFFLSLSLPSSLPPFLFLSLFLSFLL